MKVELTPLANVGYFLYNTELKGFKSVEGKSISISGFDELDLFICKTPTQITKGGWMICEGLTGYTIAGKRTRAETISAATNMLTSSNKIINERIAKTIQKTGISPRYTFSLHLHQNIQEQKRIALVHLTWPAEEEPTAHLFTYTGPWRSENQLETSIRRVADKWLSDPRSKTDPNYVDRIDWVDVFEDAPEELWAEEGLSAPFNADEYTDIYIPYETLRYKPLTESTKENEHE